MRPTRSLLAAALGAALAAPAAPALAGDTTAPTALLSPGRSAAGGNVSILNVGIVYPATFSKRRQWSAGGPDALARSSEDGTITFRLRDALTGRVHTKVTLPAAAGQPVYAPQPREGEPGPSVVPFLRIPCQEPTDSAEITQPNCGIKHRLPIWSLQRLEAYATDAAGNRSTVRSLLVTVLPDYHITVGL